MKKAIFIILQQIAVHILIIFSYWNFNLILLAKINEKLKLLTLLLFII